MSQLHRPLGKGRVRDPSRPETPHSVLRQVERLHYALRYHVMAKEGLCPGQPPVLRALYENDGLTQRELAEWLNTKASTVSVMLKRMEKNGWIERRQDETDHRLSRVYLSDQGREAEARVSAAFHKMADDCFRGMSAEDLDTLMGLLRRVRDNLQEKMEEEEKA